MQKSSKGRKIFEKYSGFVKTGKPVLTGSGIPGTYNELSVDVPFVFFHAGKYWMMHVGFDGKGYRTALAVSDRIDGEFRFSHLIFDRESGTGWSAANAAGTYILSDNNLFERRTLKKVNGRYWLFFHSYPGEGYEEGPAKMGMAWCDREDLREWHKSEQPILVPEDGGDWECGGLYKEYVAEHGGRYYLFYNAKNIPAPGKFWTEQTGVAISEDLFEWKRFPGNPVMRVRPGHFDSQFVSDPFVVWDGERWLNFYFGLTEGGARGGLAWSEDLLHWEMFPEPVLDKGRPGEIDDVHAHKSALFWENGRLYHFYTAVGNTEKGEHRLITCAVKDF